MSLIDTHAHLTSKTLAPDFASLIQNAKQADLSHLIDVAVDKETSEQVLIHAAAEPMVFAALGISPHDSTNFTRSQGQEIEQLIRRGSKIVAVGEIGLDAFHKLSPMSDQISCYQFFLDLAIELDLPVIVHMRETHTEVLSAIKQRIHKGLRGVIHCFTGTTEQAKAYLDCGFYLSFSGIVTFANSAALAEIASSIPRDRLLIETDAPYLAPVPKRGKRNEPAFVGHTCAFLATRLQCDPKELAAETSQNALSLFNRMRDFSL